MDARFLKAACHFAMKNIRGRNDHKVHTRMPEQLAVIRVAGISRRRGAPLLQPSRIRIAPGDGLCMVILIVGKPSDMADVKYFHGKRMATFRSSR